MRLVNFTHEVEPLESLTCSAFRSWRDSQLYLLDALNSASRRDHSQSIVKAARRVHCTFQAFLLSFWQQGITVMELHQEFRLWRMALLTALDPSDGWGVLESVPDRTRIEEIVAVYRELSETTETGITINNLNVRSNRLTPLLNETIEIGSTRSRLGSLFDDADIWTVKSNLVVTEGLDVRLHAGPMRWPSAELHDKGSLLRELVTVVERAESERALCLIFRREEERVIEE